MTRPGIPFPTEPLSNITWLDDDGNPIGPPVENLIHTASKGNSGEKIVVQYCYKCQHHEHVNAESRRQFPQVRVCHCPALQMEGLAPSCRSIRTDADGVTSPTCEHHLPKVADGPAEDEE